MGDDVLYASAGGDSNKRKYEDSPYPVVRRATGFSSAPDAPPPFNSVPPPMNEIEMAKQKAQEIAARLLNDSDPTKRARVENVGNGDRGFDSSDYSSQKPSGYGFGAPPQATSSGYPGPSKRIEVPNGRVGVIIGKGGETIKYLQLQSGAKIQVTRDVDSDPNSATRGVDLMGSADQISKAEQLIQVVLSDAETGGSGSGSRRMGGQLSGAEQHVMKIPNNKVGLVIGKGGETIKSMQARTGARIQVIPLHLPPGDLSQERTVQIDGTSEQIEAARKLVDEVTSENRNRNSTMSDGGYPQQGYQAHPPSNWGQPGAPMQQQGYSYPQTGAYPGQLSQYQSAYSGYPPQPTSSGYPTAWDQSAATQTPQAPQGAAAYDYYNQQQLPPQQQPPQGGPGATPTDASGYGYSAAYAQAPAYSQGQGYAQYGYGSYQAGAGYDNQQQGYGSKTSNASNPTPDGHTASHGTQDESNQGQPAANPNYPPQASNQAGYGGYAPPQAQKPPQQSPSSQGAAATAATAYSQQPGYASSQPQSVHAAYAQSAAAYAAASQPGYGAPPSYPAAPAAATQPGYSQQQPGVYNTSYAGGGYSQPPAYPSTADAGGYDSTTPPPQSAPPTGSAKASTPT